MKRTQFDAIAELDALMARFGGQEWRLTRSLNDNAGESFELEISTTAGEYREWKHVAHAHEFTCGRLDNGTRLGLATFIAKQHDALDEDIARARLSVSPQTEKGLTR